MRKVYATALHKMWLKTVSLKEQQLKSILHVPSFHDSMVYAKKALTKGTKKIPGNRALYYRARKEYEKIYTDGFDAFVGANYAILLSYSPNKTDEKKALEISKKCIKVSSSPLIKNNYAIVLFLLNKKTEAIKYLTKLAIITERRYASLLDNSKKSARLTRWKSKFRAAMKNSQYLDNNYVFTDFTSILNLALSLNYVKKYSKSEKLAFEFLSKYDQTSGWAKYLAKLTKQKIPKLTKSKYIFSVKGIKLGDNLNRVLKVLNKPSKIYTDQRGNEIWDYIKFGLKLTIEQASLVMIELNAGSMYKINGIAGIGHSRKKFEKSFGKHSSLMNSYYIYQKKNILAVEYILGEATKIYIY